MKRSPLRKRSKHPISKLKREAWRLYSLFIRQRDADKNGFVKCCTCETRKHWKQMQAGHFIPGRRNSILFDERGCHAQCYACNCGWLKGNPRMYDRFMREKYGAKVIKELEDLNYKTTKQFTEQELKDIIKKYELP